jgi:two-component system sensor histidine kinase UhpB
LSQERFEAAALATTDAIWDWDIVANSVWRSEGFQRLFGYAPEEISADIDWWIRRLHPEDRKEIVDGIQGVANGTGRMWSGQYRFRRKDGCYADVLDRTCLLRDPAGRPVRIVGGISDITERRRAEQNLERSRERLRALTIQLQSAREEERTRVAREIHDELGQILTALKLNLERLEADLGTRSAEDASLNDLLERVVETAEMTETALESVRRIATELRPVALDTLGLAAAMRQEADRFAQRTGIRCSVSLPEDPLELSRETVTALYRILQEALTNVLRHAQASEIQVCLERDGEAVRLIVRDNGRGIDPEWSSQQACFGLLGMRERASALGGEVSVHRAEPRGTEVALSLPWRAASLKAAITPSDDPNPGRR